MRFSVGNVLANGLLGNGLQDLILTKLFDLNDIPDHPSPCPCTALTVVPHEIPRPGEVFLRGDTKEVTAHCGAEHVTTSTDTLSVALDLLTTGARAVATDYTVGDSKVATVSTSSGMAVVTAQNRGSTFIEIDTTLYSLARVGDFFPIQICKAGGGVQPVRVEDCPAGQIFDPSRQLCRQLTSAVQKVGSQAATGIVISVLDNRIDCGVTCHNDFDQGETVILDAGTLPSSDAIFVEWGNDCAQCGTSAACPIQMQMDTFCSARFECPFSPPNAATLTASRDLGSSSLPIPTCGRTIRILVTVPRNMISGSGTTGSCGRGDGRVAVRVCPPNVGCTGFTIQAGQGQGLDICHDFDQTLGPFEIINPRIPGTVLSFEAVTEKTSQATIELLN